MKTITIKLSDDTHKDLKVLTSAQVVTIQDFVSGLIEKSIINVKGKN